jgi:hypothetical protein
MASDRGHPRQRPPLGPGRSTQSIAKSRLGLGI